jgi:hypothetical protein
MEFFYQVNLRVLKSINTGFVNSQFTIFYKKNTCVVEDYAAILPSAFHTKSVNSVFPTCSGNKLSVGDRTLRPSSENNEARR